MTGRSNLERFLSTNDQDPGCDQVFAVIHLYAERELAHHDAAERYPGVAAHLSICGPCAEDLKALLALATP